MELMILDASASKDETGAILRLKGGQDLFVGNDVVNEPVKKYGLSPGKFAMLCSAGRFVLEFPGKLVAHTEGEEYANAEGEVVGTYKYDGLHIESDEKYAIPTIRLVTNSTEEMLAMAKFEGKPEEIRLFGKTITQVQTIPE